MSTIKTAKISKDAFRWLLDEYANREHRLEVIADQGGNIGEPEIIRAEMENINEILDVVNPKE